MSFPLPSKSAPADAFSDFPLLDAEPVPPRIAAALAALREGRAGGGAGAVVFGRDALEECIHLLLGHEFFVAHARSFAGGVIGRRTR